MQDDYAFSQVWPLINTIDWDGPAFSVEKSYCLALFSELSYYHITKMETNETRRIKVVPCGAYQTILREGLVVDITTMLRPLDVPEPIIIEGRYTVIFVIPLRNIVIVAIRGTARAYDWLYNLNALPSKRHGLVFHRGFLKEALNQLPDLVTAIESERDDHALAESDPQRQRQRTARRGVAGSDEMLRHPAGEHRTGGNAEHVYFTGYSLGGAVASVCYAVLNRACWLSDGTDNQLPDLVTAIESLGGNAEHVYFTGYSLGGAVASVCYAVLTVPAGYQTVLTT